MSSVEGKVKSFTDQTSHLPESRLVTVTVEYRNRGILRLRLPYRGYRRILKYRTVLLLQGQ